MGEESIMSRTVVYGFGGYDSTKPNNNIVEEYETQEELDLGVGE